MKRAKWIMAYFRELNYYKLSDGEITVSWSDLKEHWKIRSEYKERLNFFEWLSEESSEYFAAKYLGV